MKTYPKVQDPSAAAWTMPENRVWSAPVNDVALDVRKYGFSDRVHTVKALAIRLDGTVYGVRSMSEVRQDGYKLDGRVSIDGKKRPAFTSSKLFHNANGDLVTVAVLVVVDREKVEQLVS